MEKAPKKKDAKKSPKKPTEKSSDKDKLKALGLDSKKPSLKELSKKHAGTIQTVILIAAVLLGGFYLVTKDNGSGNSESSQIQGENISYLDYTEKAFEDASKDTRLLFFHAEWCVQCKALEASILESEVPEGVKIFKVDYDSSQDLKKKYGVTLQTTVIRVDENGEATDRYNAYKQPSFDLVKRNLLDKE